MTPRTLDHEALLDRLTGVFRSAGYEGASLSDLSSATGLQRSSLYHRFPGGKAQMAAEVVRRVGNAGMDAAFAPLDHAQPTVADVEAVGRSLTAFYADGAISCLLDTMSLRDHSWAATGGEVADALAATAQRWIEAFAGVASSAGATPGEARARAEDAIAAIEGALVLRRVTGDGAAFARAIARLPTALMGDTKSTKSTKRTTR
ncbi:MAG: Transcriptional regulator, TetR family, partial [Ilumatobacteraceae bacterium]|nr:Transcriptional regulator, TetR family [Ilumatobacteraceae bacterium]